LLTRSHVDSGFWTMPNALAETGSRRISGRAGGSFASELIGLPAALRAAGLIRARGGPSHSLDYPQRFAPRG